MMFSSTLAKNYVVELYCISTNTVLSEVFTIMLPSKYWNIVGAIEELQIKI